MHRTNNLLLAGSESSELIAVTGNHPQLRNLIACAPEDPDSVVVVSYDTIARHSLSSNVDPITTPLKFYPATLAYGCGLIAVGGQLSELALTSADPTSNWCDQMTNSPSGSINNSIFIGPSPSAPHHPRLLVSNNDASIKMFDVVGEIPDYRAAKRRRQRRRATAANSSLLVRSGQNEWGHEMDATMEINDRRDASGSTVKRNESFSSGEDEVEEDGVHDGGGPCRLVPAEGAPDLHFDTAINHTSVSPDGRRLVAVGDTNEIFLFDICNNGTYQFVHTFEASEDASFSSDWSQTSDKFAVASQDGFVHVYDVRSLPPSGSGFLSTAPKKLATLKTTQSGPAGAARKVKFSPGSRINGELLAFNEHRSIVHIVDARTFDQAQIVQVTPPPNSNYSLAEPMPPPPRSRRPPRSDGHTSPIVQEPRNRSSATVYYPSDSTDLNAVANFRNRLIPRASANLPMSELQQLRQRLAERRDYYVGLEEDEAEDDQNDRDDDADEEEEECPPETNSESSTDYPTAETLLSRLLPDPRRSQSHPARTTLSSQTVHPPYRFTSNIFVPPDPINRPNLSGYAPLTTYSSYVSPGRAGSRATGYQPTSRYFPLESTPTDLLGLDWDEEGERIVVATEHRVWEWVVDSRARRCFGEFAWR